MSKSSSKRRRQRAKRKIELDRLRGISLVDKATSPAAAQWDNVSGPATPSFERRKHGYYQHYTSSSSPLNAPNHGNNTTLATTISTTIDSVDKSKATEEETETTFKNGILPQILTKERQKGPTWRRVEFVLPRAFGENEPFVFNPDTNLKRYCYTESNDKSLVKAMEGQPHSQLNPSIARNKTIEEILSPEKQWQLEGEQLKDNSAISSTGKDIFLSGSRRRKLEEKFEEIHRESTPSKMTAEDFIVVSKETNIQHQHKQQQHLNPVRIHDNYLTTGGTVVSNQFHLQAETEQKDVKSLQIQEQDAKAAASKAQHVSPADHTGSTGQISGRSVEEAVRDSQGLRPRSNSTDGELNLPQRGLCDERMVLEAHKWRMGSQNVPRGFHNLGNTCFLNATLQCLAYNPPFCQTLTAIYESEVQSEIKNGLQQKLYQGQRITLALCNIFRRAHGSSSSSQLGEAIAPRNIVSALPTIGSCGSKKGYRFRLGRQEDAHEFLVHLLDAMHDGELRAAGINQHNSGWRDQLPVSRLDETTFIHRIFGGYFRSQVCCQKCNYRSNTYDPFLDLSLEVSKKSSNSVLSALSEFTRKETLDAENQWKCSGCKKHVCALKQLTVFRPPLTLCIQLKRFSYDLGPGFSLNGFGGMKITKPIDFPANLNLPLSDGRSCPYLLTGVVIHVGGSSSSGHYTAYVKRPDRKGISHWYHIDDSFVQPVSEKTVLRQKDAYLLFYCRREVKLEFPAPPPRSMSASEAAEIGRVRARARSDSMPKKAKEIAPGEADEKSLRRETEPRTHDLVENKAIESNLGIQRVMTKIHPLASPSSLQQDSENQSNNLVNLENRNDNSTMCENGPCNAGSALNEARRARNIGKSSNGSLNSLSMVNAKDKIAISTNGHDVSSESISRKAVSHASEPTKSVHAMLCHDEADHSDKHKSHEADRGRTHGNFCAHVDISTSAESKLDRSTTRIVLNNSDSRGKVKVMLGPRKRKLWESTARALPSKSSSFHLLGNMEVSRWDDSDSSDADAQESVVLMSNTIRSDVNDERQRIVEKMERQDCFRKRKMHLDRWDAHLDQGKTKKVKSKKATNQTTGTDAKTNIFQRIQSGVERLNRGKAKGIFYRPKGYRKGNKRKTK